MGAASQTDWQRQPWQDGRPQPQKAVQLMARLAVGGLPRRRINPAGPVGELAARGQKVDYRSVWEFVHAEKLTHKKDTDCQRAGAWLWLSVEQPCKTLGSNRRAAAQ